MAKELLVHSGHQPDLRMHRSLSLSLTLCPRVGNHRDTAGRKPFPPLPTALGCLPARLPDTTNTQQGISTSGLPRCVWGGGGWGARLGPPVTTTREDYTEGRGGREKGRGEGGWGGGRRGKEGMASTLPHSPPSPSPTSFSLSFI